MAKEPTAKPATKSVTLRNDGEGSRSFFTADREQVTLRPDEEWKGDILAADVDDLSSDLNQNPKEGEGEATDEAAAGRAVQERAEALVKANDLASLQTQAKSLRINFGDEADAPELAVLIAQAEAAK